MVRLFGFSQESRVTVTGKKYVCFAADTAFLQVGAKTQQKHGSKGRGATASEKICSPLEPWAASRIQEIQCDGDCTMFTTLNLSAGWTKAGRGVEYV